MTPPILIHPDCEAYQSLAEKAWMLARQNVRRYPASGKPAFMKEGFDEENLYFWDTCFMLQYAKYSPDTLPGVATLEKFFAVQRNDGFIPRCFNLKTGRSPLPYDDINPPLAAWSLLDVIRQTGNTLRLEEHLKHLVSFDEWIERTRRRKDGTWWFSDGAGSGMDNSPRTARRNKEGNDVGWIDLAAQQALSAESISELARIAGDSALESAYREIYEKRLDFLERRHWCRKTGMYLDLLLQGLETESYRAYFSSAKSIASFWPMLAEKCDKERLRRLLLHLLNPEEFNRPHPVPSLSYDNPNYSANGCYWQGGVWAPTNYMIVRGLLRNEQYASAREITLRHLDFMDRVYRHSEPHTIWEAYSPETARPAKIDCGVYGKEEDEIPVRKDFCGWSALGPISMLIEAVLGIECDYPARKIVWHSNCYARHGIENLPFGPARISLIAERSNPGEIPQIAVTAPFPVKIEFKRF